MAKHIGSLLLLLLFGLVPSPSLQAAIVVTDQFWTGETGDRDSVGDWSVGQSFIPTLSGLDVVELKVGDIVLDGLGFSLFVNIREDSILGDILATSRVTSLPDGFGRESPLIAQGDVALFEFDTVVPLTPGNRYVIEVDAVEGDAFVYFGFLNPYDLGGAYLFGQTTESAGADLYFREGLSASAVPEPSSLAALAIGVTFAGFVRRRRANTRQHQKTVA